MPVTRSFEALRVELVFERTSGGAVDMTIWSVTRGTKGSSDPRCHLVTHVPAGAIHQDVLQEVETVLDAVIDRLVDDRFGMQMAFSL